MGSGLLSRRSLGGGCYRRRVFLASEARWTKREDTHTPCERAPKQLLGCKQGGWELNKPSFTVWWAKHRGGIDKAAEATNIHEWLG